MKTRNQLKNDSSKKHEQQQGFNKPQAASTSNVKVINSDTDTNSTNQIIKQPIKQVDSVRKLRIDRSKSRLQPQDVSNENNKPALRQLRSRKDISNSSKNAVVTTDGPDDTNSTNQIIKHPIKQVDAVRKLRVNRSETQLQPQEVSIENNKPVLRQLRSRKDISNSSKTAVVTTDGPDDKTVKYMKSCKVSLNILDIKKYNISHVPVYKTLLPSANDEGNKYEFVADNEPAVHVKKTRTGFKVLKKTTKTRKPTKKQYKVSKNIDKKSKRQMPNVVTTEKRNPSSADENIIIPDKNTDKESSSMQQNTAMNDKNKSKEIEKSNKHVTFNEQASPGRDENSDDDFDLGEVELEHDVHVEHIPESNNNKANDFSHSDISKEQTPQIEVTPVASSYNRNKIAARSLSYSTFTSPIMAQNCITHISTPMRVNMVESPRIPANYPVKQHSYLPAYMREATHFNKDNKSLQSHSNDSLPSISHKEINSTQTTLTRYKINSNVSGLYEDPRIDPKKTRSSNKPVSINILDSFNKANKSLSEALSTQDEVEISNYNVDNYFGFETIEDNLFPITKKATNTRVITQKPTRISLTEIKNLNSKIKTKPTKRSYGKENMTNIKMKKSPNKKNDALSPQKVIENSSPVISNIDSVEVAPAPIVNIEETASEAVESETAAPLLSSIALFEDLEGDEDIIHHKKVNRRSYERPLYARRNRSMNESSDLELMPEVEDVIKKVYPKKKKPKNKMTKKEAAAYEEWAKSFNSMCEDIEANPILIE